MTEKVINVWQDLALTDLFFAFRKAKTDCFFERSICIASQFSEYEQDLASRLMAMLARLQANEVASVLQQNLGTIRIIVKKLGIKPKKNIVWGSLVADPQSDAGTQEEATGTSVEQLRIACFGTGNAAPKVRLPQHGAGRTGQRV